MVSKDKSKSQPKSKKKSKKKVGRPSVPYHKNFCEMVQRACMLGATNEELAKKLNVSLSTIDRWINTKTDFRSAIKKGRCGADQDVAVSLYHRAVGYSHPDVHISSYMGEITITNIIKHYPPDTGAACMWLKNRRPDLWRDKPENDSEISEPQPITITIEVEDASLKN